MTERRIGEINLPLSLLWIFIPWLMCIIVQTDVVDILVQWNPWLIKHGWQHHSLELYLQTSWFAAPSSSAEQLWDDLFPKHLTGLSGTFKVSVLSSVSIVFHLWSITFWEESNVFCVKNKPHCHNHFRRAERVLTPALWAPVLICGLCSCDAGCTFFDDVLIP